MFVIPKYLKKTDISTAFIIGGVCAALGPVGAVLVPITTIGQFIYVHYRYKREVEYANTVNPILGKMMNEYIKKNM